jgi:1-pyrroline-5-carboxylate dehydrogenase
MLFANGAATEKVLVEGNLRNVLFTGSSKVAEHLTQVLKGRIKYHSQLIDSLEDAGFDWKILGPDVPNKEGVDYVVW